MHKHSHVKLNLNNTARIEVQTVVARLESKEGSNDPNDNVTRCHDEVGQETADKEQHQGQTHTTETNSLDNDDNPELLACFQRIWERGELYKGAGPLTWTLAISNFIFFFVNAFVKETVLNGQGKKSVPPHLSLLGSCLAGSINVLFTNPLWVTNLRIISNQSTHPSMLQEMAHIVQMLGWRHLWQGTSASLLLVSNPVIQFFCYEQIKAWRVAHRAKARPRKPNVLPPVEAFLLGALAKGIATILTYPLQLAQAVLRMQNKQQRHDGSKPRATTTSSSKGIFECLRSIQARDGWKGLYTGMNAKLLQTVLAAAFTFLTYEQILGAVYAVHKKLLRSAVATRRPVR